MHININLVDVKEPVSVCYSMRLNIKVDLDVSCCLLYFYCIHCSRMAMLYSVFHYFPVTYTLASLKMICTRKTDAESVFAYSFQGCYCYIVLDKNFVIAVSPHHTG